MGLETREGGGGTIGLGWLLGLSLGGGILLFSAIGLLLAWRIKRRPEAYTTATYYGSQNHQETSDGEGGVPPSASRSTRLLKRSFFTSTTSIGGFSSHVSLPQLPSLASLNMTGRRLSRTFTVDEEAAHGPKVNRTVRESWLRDSWFTRMPTLPNLEPQEAELQSVQPQHEPEEVNEHKRGPNEQRIEVAKRQHKVPASKTAPELTMDDGSPIRGRSRAPAETHQQTQSASSSPEKQHQKRLNQSPRKQQLVRPSGTETDLKFILQSTEQRLRDGSQSPTKTPRHSPSKSNPSPSKSVASPMKTPKSYRSVASSAQTPGSASGRTPNKRTLGYGTSPAKTHSRASSVGSAANSLIEAATQELDNPGGLSSPSRGRSGAQSRQDYNSDVRSRSSSADSHASSSLSTLYSVGDAEEAIATAGGDPFVEDRTLQVGQTLQKKSSWEAREQPNGPRPLNTGELRRANTLSTVNSRIDISAIPAPLRTGSVNSGVGQQRQSWKINSERLGVMFQQPIKTASEDVRPKRQHLAETKTEESVGDLTEAFSDCSMVTDSVHTTDSEATEAPASEITPKAGNRPASVTPRRRLDSMADLSSSPLSEEDIIDLLTVTNRSSRAAPRYPKMANLVFEDSIISTPLSPRPRDSSTAPKAQSRKVSSESTSSSNYDQESVTSVDIRIDDSAARDGHKHTSSLGNAIAELRRMNSVVSSYSVASLASTVFGGDVGESPSIPSLRGGGFAPARTNSKTAKTGGRNYLNLGGSGQNNKGKASQGDKTTTKQPRRGHARSKSAIPVRTATATGKENQGLGLRTVRFDIPARGLREGRRAGNASPLPHPTEGHLKEAADDMVVESIKREEKRKKHESADSLNLFDTDRFLMSSPERDNVTRGGRLRV